uniref:Uncharacterized protein n=1 Tax=Arundo donax TaxID=35708 RepID=A0A0A9APJ5_ARUDO
MQISYIILNVVFYFMFWREKYCDKCTQLSSNREKKIIIPSCLGIGPRTFCCFLETPRIVRLHQCR